MTIRFIRKIYDTGSISDNCLIFSGSHWTTCCNWAYHFQRPSGNCEMCLRLRSLSITVTCNFLGRSCENLHYTAKEWCFPSHIWVVCFGPLDLVPSMCVCIGHSLPGFPTPHPTPHTLFGKDAEWLMHTMPGLELPGALARYFLSKSYFFPASKHFKKPRALLFLGSLIPKAVHF